MTPAILLRAGIVWCVILGFAILNGALREGVLIPRLGNPWAQMLSGVLLSACILVAAWIFVARTPPLSTQGYLAIGVLWLVITLGFEFGFGHLVRHRSWSELTLAYQFHDGNLWPIVLVIVTASPWLAATLQHRVLP